MGADSQFLRVRPEGVNRSPGRLEIRRKCPNKIFTNIAQFIRFTVKIRLGPESRDRNVPDVLQVPVGLGPRIFLDNLF